MDLEEHIKSDLDIELLKRTPSAYLGSCRFKLPEICDDREIYDKIFSILDKLEVEYFSISAAMIPWTPSRNFLTIPC